MTAIEQSSLQRVEHAQEPAYLQSHPRLQSALLEYKEALQKFEEVLNEDESQPPNDQSLRLLSPSEVCMELGIPALKLGPTLRVRQADLQEYMNREQHLRSLGEEDSFRER